MADAPPVPPIEIRSPSDNELLESQSTASPRHVPLDYFSRNESQVSAGFQLPPVHDQTGGTGTLVEDEFRFDKFLQDKWDEATAERINHRHTGLAFKVRLRSMSLLFSIS